MSKDGHYIDITVCCDSESPR